MELKHTSHKNCDLIKVTGRVDSATSDQLEQLLKKIQAGGRHNLVIDMTDVDFISSRGIWVLVESQKVAKAGNKGQIVLAAIPSKIKESLELIGMLAYFTVFDDVVGAVGSF